MSIEAGLFRSISSLILLLLVLACLLQPFSSVHGDEADLPNPSLALIDPDLYHSSVGVMEEVNSIVAGHPDKFTLETITSANQGYSAEVSVVTYSRNRNVSNDKEKFRILLSFGQHGRELITSELALRILSILSQEQFLQNMDPVSLNRTLDRLVIKVIPMENLNGRRRVEAGDRCERRNGRGVDLNRNWSVDWGKKEKDYDPYEENPGSAPFSEPESQIMQKLAFSFEPHIWVNVHSGMEALFMPYDHKNTTPKGLPSHRMKLLLEELNHLHCKQRCMIGSGGGSVGYLAHGTATDYMYDILRVPMAFTFEIYGDGEASTKDCFKMFNPIDSTTFNRVLNDWSAAFLTMFVLGPRQLVEVDSKPFVTKGVSIDEYLEGYLIERSSRYGKKMEVFELGMQEIRAYFRLFLLSSVLLFFMFCSRISKSRCNRPIVSATQL